MSNEQHQANGTKSIDKALKVLKCFIGSSEYLTMTRIANQLELPYSTTSRILSILEEEGFLQRDPLTKRYKLGKCAYLLGYYARLEDTLQKIVSPYLVKLKNEFEETSTMYIREGHIRRASTQRWNPKSTSDSRLQ
jgi:DNA-binding IclR family transcriptional regulator